MKKTQFPKNRLLIAIAIAATADLLQFPENAAAATGLLFVPAEFTNLVIDAFVLIALICLLGFHWALLPSLLTEIIPGIDLYPTWTGFVAFMAWKISKEQSSPANEIQSSTKVSSPHEIIAPTVSLPTIKRVRKIPKSSK